MDEQRGVPSTHNGRDLRSLSAMGEERSWVAQRARKDLRGAREWQTHFLTSLCTDCALHQVSTAFQEPAAHHRVSIFFRHLKRPRLLKVVTVWDVIRRIEADGGLRSPTWRAIANSPWDASGWVAVRATRRTKCVREHSPASRNWRRGGQHTTDYAIENEDARRTGRLVGQVLVRDDAN